MLKHAIYGIKTQNSRKIFSFLTDTWQLLPNYREFLEFSMIEHKVKQNLNRQYMFGNQPYEKLPSLTNKANNDFFFFQV